MTKLLLSIALLGCAAPSIRVVKGSDGACVVYRDGQEVAARNSRGLVYSEGTAPAVDGEGDATCSPCAAAVLGPDVCRRVIP